MIMLSVEITRLGVSFAVFLINVPFGFFRVRFKKFSRPWGRCIYLPIVIGIVLRRFIFHWDWNGVPYLFSAAILGHVLGGIWGNRRLRKSEKRNAKSVVNMI